MPQRTTTRWTWILAVTLLTALYLLPRLMYLDASVTTDEPIWLGRSANFYRALFQGDLADTFQFAHPGVPTMWAGMVGYWFAFPDYIDDYSTNYGITFDIHQRIRASGLHELDVLIAARVSKIVLQAVFFVIAIVFCRRRFGGAVAVLTGVIIALDPFLIAHDRLLHVDGLFAISCFAAVLALADAFATGHDTTRPWIVAGVLAAIAWLTRSTGAVLGVVVVAWMAIDLVRERSSSTQPLGTHVLGRLRAGLIWGGAALLTTVALWPALWVAPVATLGFMVEWSTKAAESGHGFPTFFNGAIQHGDPGWRFYPVTLLWRLTPLTMLGVALFLCFLVSGATRTHLTPRQVRTIGIVFTFALLYVTGMSLGAKKFDRYILPVYPIVDLLAALGLVMTAQLVMRMTRAGRQALVAAALALAIVVQGGSYLSARVYPLDYYNPLLGGLDRAVHEVRIGWGETLSETAEYILAEADGEALTVRTSSSRAPLLYFLPEPIVVEPGDFETIADWEATDYYVTSIQQWQRDIEEDVIGYLEGFDPVKVVSIDGVPFSRVYDLNDIPPPPFLAETAGNAIPPNAAVLPDDPK